MSKPCSISTETMLNVIAKNIMKLELEVKKVREKKKDEIPINALKTMTNTLNIVLGFVKTSKKIFCKKIEVDEYFEMIGIENEKKIGKLLKIIIDYSMDFMPWINNIPLLNYYLSLNNKEKLKDKIERLLDYTLHFDSKSEYNKVKDTILEIILDWDYTVGPNTFKQMHNFLVIYNCTNDLGLCLYNDWKNRCKCMNDSILKIDFQKMCL